MMRSPDLIWPRFTMPQRRSAAAVDLPEPRPAQNTSVGLSSQNMLFWTVERSNSSVSASRRATKRRLRCLARWQHLELALGDLLLRLLRPQLSRRRPAAEVDGEAAAGEELAL